MSATHKTVIDRLPADVSYAKKNVSGDLITYANIDSEASADMRALTIKRAVDT